MKPLSFKEIADMISATLKKIFHFNFASRKQRHMFSFLDRGNPFTRSSLHWDEYGNPYIYFGGSRKRNSHQ